jgi:8-oxo-dGTP pyrophosphatase MutT (NUDIX family)
MPRPANAAPGHFHDRKPMRIIDRLAMRAILLTPEDRVLLLRVDYGTGTWWITPGGGVEPGETPQATLRRELHEELGHVPAGPAALVWRRRFDLPLPQAHWRQSESYFLIETDQFVPAIQDAPEADAIREFRWWSVAEIRQSGERIAPASLERIVLDYRRLGPPREPPDLEIVED